MNCFLLRRRFVVASIVLAIVNITAPSLLAGDRLSKYMNHPAFRWQTAATEHFTIYYEAASATVPRLDEVKKSIETSRADEGFASFSDERWRNRDVLAARLGAQGRLLPLKTLAEDFLKHPEGVTYIESASFLGFVIERYGMEKFKEVWKGGFKRLPKVLGRSVTELEAEWRATLPSDAEQLSTN
jgi:hypothetical protein